MAITIKPALRKNPQNKDAAAKYYAQVVLAPEMALKQIVEQIADRCTLTGSDIKAVLDALMTVISASSTALMSEPVSVQRSAICSTICLCVISGPSTTCA